MTPQAVFDKCARHLLTQRARSSVVVRDPEGKERESCRYRGPEGRLCAAGPFIPDYKYTPSLENNLVGVKKVDRALCFSAEEHPASVDLLKSLQLVHDHEPVPRWPRVLRDVARTKGLSSAVVDEMEARGAPPL
jgi:hypothetical protein